MHPIERLRHVARAGDADPSLLAEEAALALGSLAANRRALVPASRRLLEFHPLAAPLWWVCAELLCAAEPTKHAYALADELAGDPTGEELAAALPGAATLVTTGGRVIGGGLVERPDLTVRLLAPPARLRQLLRRLNSQVDCSGYLEEELEECLAGSDLVVVEALALGPQGALVSPVSGRLVQAARRHGVDCWLASGVGRALPAELLEALLDAIRPGVSSEDGDELEHYGVAAAAETLDWSASEESPSLLDPALIGVVVGPEGPRASRQAFLGGSCAVPAELIGWTRTR